MKKIKTLSKDFYYKDLNFIHTLNYDLPINLSQIEHIIDNIHNQYPLINKVNISIIVKSFFENLRYFLIIGNIININRFAFDMKLLYFINSFKGKNPSLKVQVSTPGEMKK